MDDKNKPYYIPITLSDFAGSLQNMIRENGQLTGSEEVADVAFIRDSDSPVPPGSIVIRLKTMDISMDEPEYGSLYVMPITAKILQ